MGRLNQSRQLLLEQDPVELIQQAVAEVLQDHVGAPKDQIEAAINVSVRAALDQTGFDLNDLSDPVLKLEVPLPDGRMVEVTINHE